MALRDSGHADEAIASFRRALEIDPQYAQAHANLGDALLALGELAEAAASYRRAIELDPRTANTHNNLGKALILQGNWDEAIQSFRRVLEIDARHAPAYINLGIALDALGRTDEALEANRQAAELFAQDPSAFGRQWLEVAKQSITRLEEKSELLPYLDAVLDGRPARSSTEWNMAIRHGYDRRRHRDVVALAEDTLREAPELIDDVTGLYDSACSATLLAAGSDSDVSEAERVRVRELARAWLGREVERWIAQREQGGESATAARERLKHALEDPDFASVRGAAIERLPAGERAAWRALWQRIESATAH
jgi:lipopolysaccharide biosynthesis regulator YciM